MIKNHYPADNQSILIETSSYQTTDYSIRSNRPKNSLEMSHGSIHQPQTSSYSSATMQLNLEILIMKTCCFNVFDFLSIVPVGLAAHLTMTYRKLLTFYHNHSPISKYPMTSPIHHYD